MPAEHSHFRCKGNFHSGYSSGHAHGDGHEHESHLRSKDNPRSDAHQPRGKRTGEPKHVEGTIGFTGAFDYEHSPKAHHHPPVGHREPHQFSSGRATGAHGFGHGPEHRKGALRLSGKKGAHRIGAR